MLPIKRILLVDDDSAVLSVLKRALSDYDVTSAQGAEEALAIASHREPPDLLITDYLMPSMMGDELLGRLRERLPKLKVLVITAHGDILSRENLTWWASEAHLSKPFHVEELRKAVSDLIGPA